MRDKPYIFDRITALELFDAMLGHGPSHRILRIAGGAKMGKSHLLRAFYRRAGAEFQTLCAMVELGEDLADPQSILFALKNQLRGLNFERYTHALETLPKQTIEVKETSLFFSKFSAEISENQKSDLERQRKLTHAFIEDLNSNGDRPTLLCFDTIDNAPTLHGWFQHEFLSGVCQSAHVSVVVAGRELPPNPIQLQMHCCDHALERFDLCHYQEVKECLELALSDDEIKLLYKAFDGKPGPYFEVVPRFRGAT